MKSGTINGSWCALCHSAALIARLPGHEMALAEHWSKGGALHGTEIGRQLSSNCSLCMAEQPSNRLDGACKPRCEAAVVTCRCL